MKIETCFFSTFLSKVQPQRVAFKKSVYCSIYKKSCDFFISK